MRKSDMHEGNPLTRRKKDNFRRSQGMRNWGKINTELTRKNSIQDSANTNVDVTMKTQTISDLFVTGLGEEDLPKEGAEDPENIYIDASFREEKPVSNSSTPTDSKLVALSIFENLIMSRTLLVGNDILQGKVNPALLQFTRAEADLAVPESTANPFSAIPKQRTACMPNQSLYTLIYACDILEDNREDFEETCKNIGSISREKNRERGITGMLMMYEVPDKPGVFGAIQRLEGSKNDVYDLYNTICKDRRASNFEVLAEKPITETSFGEWHMGLWVGYPDADELEDHRQALFYDSASGAYMNKVSSFL